VRIPSGGTRYRWIGYRLTIFIAAAAVLNSGCQTYGSLRSDFPLEATITEIHKAMEQGRLTARELVQMYLDRIEAYDRQGPSLNAIIVVNPNALQRAEELDAEFARSGLTGPLHGIPVIVKDNYDTHDLPTTAGSRALAGSIPPDDSFQVRKLREAGAIVLAKSNMAEFAFSPYETIGSAMPGYTFNPYALNRVTAGSSGGTAAAVASSFGVIGLGTDTGNSIRGPSSHTCLVGIRSTMGLTSRDGIIPLYLNRDIGGPMARTVRDAVIVFDVIAGYDPADPVTEQAPERRVERYADYLNDDALSGARIGVFRFLSNTDSADPEVLQRFEEALQAMSFAGAVIVDPVEIPNWDELRRMQLWCSRFKPDLNDYLASLGPDAPIKSFDELLESGRFHTSIASRLRSMDRFEGRPEENEGCLAVEQNEEVLRSAIRQVMETYSLDALVYPTWNNPPRLIGDLRSPHGNNSQALSPPTGFPAITVPMGFVGGGLPVGLQILGDAWSEPRLIEIAFSFEQATLHRRPPQSTSPLYR